MLACCLGDEQVSTSRPSGRLQQILYFRPGIRPVSYTHLDVYKRQRLRLRHSGSSLPSIGRLHSSDRFFGGERSSPEVEFDRAANCFETIEPVSERFVKNVQWLDVQFLDIWFVLGHLMPRILNQKRLGQFKLDAKG